MTAQTDAERPATFPVPPPPARAYSDPAVLAEERAAIWRSSWVVAGAAAAVAAPKSFMTTEIAGTPVVVTRDRDGALHALANVCQHRGMVLAAGCGSAMTLSCPNHAWTYALDGRLKGAPRSSVEESFDPASIRLPEYAVLEWGPLLLVSLDPDAEPPLAELAQMDAVLTAAGLRFADMRQVGEALDWTIAANWKIVIENFCECYHCAWVHRDFSTVFDVSSERYACQPSGGLLTATSPVRPAADPAVQRRLLVTDGPMTDSHWFLLYPGATVNVYPGAGAVEVTWYWPVDADTTGARTLLFVATDATADYEQQIVALLTQVGEEDNAICEGMHRGMRSGALERARLLPANEPLIAAFHGLLAERVAYPEVG